MSSSPSVSVSVALVGLHMQNFTLQPDGLVGSNGSARDARERGVASNVNRLLATARGVAAPVIYVSCAFDSGYTGLNESMPNFITIRDAGELHLGMPSVEIFDELDRSEDDTILYHTGICPFTGTDLSKILTARKIDQVMLFGVSIRWIVEAGVYEANDRGFRTIVVSDCSAAASRDLHQQSVDSLRNFCTVLTTDEAVGVLEACK